MVKRCGVEGKVQSIEPTENIHIDVKQSYEDFVYRVENGDLHHFEFESDNITTDDLYRFREYEAVTSRNFKSPVITHVLCSSGVKKPVDKLEAGINTYRVIVHRYKDDNADDIILGIRQKRDEEITRDDLAELMFTPLMSGNMKQKERVMESLVLLNNEYTSVTEEDRKRMQSVLYVFASKFLTREEMKDVKEAFSMNPLGQMIFDDGVQSGLARGKAEDILLILQNVGPVTDELSERIGKERDHAVLHKWLMLAARAESVEDFTAAM